MQEYRNLPAFLAGWDIAIMPFARNDVVRPYGELGLVAIADSADAFVATAEAMLRQSATERANWLREVDALLAQNSWDQSWPKMSHLIDEVLQGSPLTSSGTAAD
ncbi:MAG: hypothetical protein H0T73_17575 [Ardenticatenales bacterium]|nr:hypothetical protein [Ardenticatenales bacterium]